MMLLVTASALTLSPNAVIVDYAKVTLALADEVAQVQRKIVGLCTRSRFQIPESPLLTQSTILRLIT